jgi:hypothetical protein
LVQEVLEVESGRRNDRPALATALKLCRKHRATLVIAKLDRLARNVAFISNLMESGGEFVAELLPTITAIQATGASSLRAIAARTQCSRDPNAPKTRGMVCGSGSKDDETIDTQLKCPFQG